MLPMKLGEFEIRTTTVYEELEGQRDDAIYAIGEVDSDGVFHARGYFNFEAEARKAINAINRHSQLVESLEWALRHCENVFALQNGGVQQSAEQGDLDCQSLLIARAAIEEAKGATNDR